MRHEAKFDQPEPILVLAGELEQILLVTVFDVGPKNASLIQINYQRQLMAWRMSKVVGNTL